jgi:hypothetical protein
MDGGRKIMEALNHQRKEPALTKKDRESGVPAAKDAPMDKKKAAAQKPKAFDIDSPEALINRELSWLSFARRVLALVEDPELALIERVKFGGIMGMLYDETNLP